MTLNEKREFIRQAIDMDAWRHSRDLNLNKLCDDPELHKKIIEILHDKRQQRKDEIAKLQKAEIYLAEFMRIYDDAKEVNQ
jgi:hypothetical protein